MRVFDGYIYRDETPEEIKAREERDRLIAEEEAKHPRPKTDREMIEELSSKQDDLTLRQEDIELMIADAIGGAI